MSTTPVQYAHIVKGIASANPILGGSFPPQASHSPTPSGDNISPSPNCGEYLGAQNTDPAPTALAPAPSCLGCNSHHSPHATVSGNVSTSESVPGSSFHVPPNESIPVITPNPDAALADKMVKLCLVGRIFGDPPYKHIIESKLGKSWSFIKGTVSFKPMGNNWFLIEFSNLSDKLEVWNNRPWFVLGLNFVIYPWNDNFDAYLTPVSDIDQWVKIHLLPIHYWSEECLSTILAPVGQLIKLDKITIEKKKVRYAKACVNISVEKAVPGSLNVKLGSPFKQIHLNYEGMSEICPICGSDEHSLELCPAKHSPATHLLVDRVNIPKLDPHAVPNTNTPVPTKWVKVVPRKRAATRTSFRRFSPGLTRLTPKQPTVNPTSSTAAAATVVISNNTVSHNSFDPLLSHESMDDIMNQLDSPAPALLAATISASPDPSSTMILPTMVSPNSPNVYEYGSNLELSPSEELEFFEAMGISTADPNPITTPPTATPGKRRRTDDDMAASPTSDYD